MKMEVEKRHSIYFKGSNSCQAICRQKMVGGYLSGRGVGEWVPTLRHEKPRWGGSSTEGSRPGGLLMGSLLGGR